MKRAAIGLGVASGALLLGMSGEAGAQSSPQCETVYDETLQGDSSAALRQEIGEYAAAGVEVHVQIIEDAHDEGVSSSSDAEGFADRLAAQCGWSSNGVNVFISLEPRAYDIHRTGKADRDISQSTVDSAEPNLINDLRDGGTSFQADAANLLDRINPYDLVAVTQPPASRSAATEVPSEPRDIPVKEILGGIAGLAVIGAAGARLKRAHSLRAEVKELTEGNSSQVSADLTSEIFDTDEQLKVLPEDDALELRDYHNQAAAELAAIIAARQDLETTYKAERKRLWPNLYAVVNKSLAVEGTADDGQEKLDQLKQERAQVEGFITQIDERVRAFNELVQTADEVTKQVQAGDSGWDLGYYMDTFNTFTAARDQVADLRTKNYIEKPAEVMDQVDDKVTNFLADIAALPGRREAADQAVDLQPATIETRKNTINEAVKILGELRQHYDESCVKGINAVDDTLTELLDELQDYNQLASHGRGVKSVVELENTEKSNHQFDDVALRIENIAASVHERARLLENIKATLQDTVNGTANEIAEARQTAFDRYRDDVEDETRDQIKELEKKFDDYRNEEVSVDKPKYLELAENLADYKNQAASLTRQAVAEKQEMDNLRSNISQLEHEARANLASLENYIASHSDVDSSTESSAHSIRLFDGDTSQSRKGLRNQVEDFRRQLAEIEQVQNEARADVRREEERRRRQQEEEDRRRRQREEDERRRQQASSYTSYSSSSSFDSGSSFGGGGGSSHDSGSW